MMEMLNEYNIKVPTIIKLNCRRGPKYYNWKMGWIDSPKYASIDTEDGAKETIWMNALDDYIGGEEEIEFIKGKENIEKEISDYRNTHRSWESNQVN